MSKKVKSINLDKVSIITSPQYLGLIIGFVFTIGASVGGFFNMREQISDLKSKTVEIDLKSSEELKTTNRELLSRISSITESNTKIRETVAEMRGQLKLLSLKN
jgi:hypothetical protein